MNADILFLLVIGVLWLAASTPPFAEATHRAPALPMPDDGKPCPRCKGACYDPDPQEQTISKYRPSPELDWHGKPTGKLLCRQCGGYGTV